MTIDGNKLQTVGALIAGVPEPRLRELAIQALRLARQQRANQDHFSRHGELGLYLVPLLAQAQNVPLNGDPNSLKEVFIEADTYPALAPIADFLHWFVRAGFAMPMGAPVNRFPITYRLTPAGVRLLEAGADHPLLPGAVARVQTRCPGLPSAVVSLLNDAHACLERELLRPSVVVLGVAYEVTVEHVIDALIGRGILTPDVRDLRAAARIQRVRNVIDATLPAGTPEERDDRFSVHRAYNFADDLRRRRNDAAHTRPRFGLDDRGEVEELFVSAIRSLPALWRMHAP